MATSFARRAWTPVPLSNSLHGDLRKFIAATERPWTVLPHGPIEKLEANLWAVEGVLPRGHVPRRMCIARTTDGRLLFLNAMPLREEAMRKIETFGDPACLLVPNSLHRLDIAAFKLRYPELRILTGPRWRIGPRDLAALGRRASALASTRGDVSEAEADVDVGDTQLRAHQRGGQLGHLVEHQVGSPVRHDRFEVVGAGADHPPRRQQPRR